MISAAVPVKNISSARYKDSRLISSSFIVIPKFFDNSITVSLVIPVNIPAEAGGVNNMLFLTINRFSPAPSDTLPSVDKAIPSSKPRRFASVLIKVLDR